MAVQLINLPAAVFNFTFEQLTLHAFESGRARVILRADGRRIVLLGFTTPRSGAGLVHAPMLKRLFQYWVLNSAAFGPLADFVADETLVVVI